MPHPTFNNTIEILPVISRQGLYSTDTFLISPSRARLVRLRLDIDPNDYINPNLSAKLTVLRSEDNGTTWIPYGGMTWRGGPYTEERTGEVNPAPFIQVNLDAIQGQLAKGELDVPQPTIIGVTLLW